MMYCLACIVCIIPIGHPDGSVSAELPNPAVREGVLKRILTWKEAGKSDDDIFKILRSETVPSGYTIHKWTPGISYKFSEYC